MPIFQQSSVAGLWNHIRIRTWRPGTILRNTGPLVAPTEHTRAWKAGIWRHCRGCSLRILGKGRGKCCIQGRRHQVSGRSTNVILMISDWSICLRFQGRSANFSLRFITTLVSRPFLGHTACWRLLWDTTRHRLFWDTTRRRLFWDTTRRRLFWRLFGCTCYRWHYHVHWFRYLRKKNISGSLRDFLQVSGDRFRNHFWNKHCRWHCSRRGHVLGGQHWTVLGGQHWTSTINLNRFCR